MSPLRLNGSTSGYSQLDAPAIAGDQTFTLPGTGGTIDRLNRAGNILQVVQGSVTGLVSSTSSTYADTNLTASITPSFSSSKILVIVCQGVYANASDSNTRLIRNSSTLVTQGYATTANDNDLKYVNFQYLDSPATTSSTTYKTQFNRSAGTNPVYVNYTDSGGTQTSFITLMEVAA